MGRKGFSSLKIRNTLTDGESILRTSDSKLKWYACGPTVYDDAHIGHARTYVNTDIIRRIISDYFKQDVDFAMGMTDIDDKIITRSEENNTHWKKLARKYEASFMRDMESLNIRRPDTILRVTEHIDDIIQYIQRIVDQDMAYVTPSGVYFDVYKQKGKYGKLGNIPTSDDSESQPSLIHKKSSRDFALWKVTARTDEADTLHIPLWKSPWGYGRPGWHIECSAMTHSYFGHEVDIHSGGIDLRFPHHTNEIAQSEAHGCCDHWVDFWLHTGHLYIEGRKMSKSLKNFISVDDYLSGRWRGLNHSAQQTQSAAADLRMFFLQHKYHSSLHFSGERIHEASVIRKKIEGPLSLSMSVLPGVAASASTAPKQDERRTRMNEASLDLSKRLAVCREGVRIALSNDFDTPVALSHLVDLSGHLNSFVLQHVINDPSQPIDPVPAVRDYLIDMTKIFGFHVKQDNQSNTVHIMGSSYLDSKPRSDDENETLSSITDSQQTHQLVDSFVKFRSKVRSKSADRMKLLKKIKKEAKGNKSEDDVPMVEDVLNAETDVLVGLLGDCDAVREELARESGIEIKDIGQNSSWSFREDTVVV